MHYLHSSIFSQQCIVEIKYKFIYCNYSKSLNFLIINFAVECWKFMIIFKTVRRYSVKEIMEACNTGDWSVIFSNISISPTDRNVRQMQQMLEKWYSGIFSSLKIEIDFIYINFLTATVSYLLH